ncbi:hypothetical protein KKG24_02295 [Patescibacteria group bacterium]|nr:hypothetical protein [Patescibacteria group bacterium]
MSISNIIKDPNTNWKYLLIVFILGVLAGGGILAWQSGSLPSLTSPTPTPTPTPPVDETADWKVYRNEEYGFEVSLLDSWKGYSVFVGFWSGVTLDSKSTKFQGPQIVIRNPKWTINPPSLGTYQDIPIMVFTTEEWSLIEAGNLNVSAAPVGPNKLGENQKYVFALPPRWVGFTDALGQEEAVEIVKTFKAF